MATPFTRIRKRVSSMSAPGGCPSPGLEELPHGQVGAISARKVRRIVRAIKVVTGMVAAVAGLVTALAILIQAIKR